MGPPDAGLRSRQGRFSAWFSPRRQQHCDPEVRDEAAATGIERIGWRISVLIWLIPTLLSATTSYAFTRITGNPVGFWTVLVINLPIWYFWALATPVIFWIGKMAPIGWPGSPAAIALHVAASVVAAFADVSCGMTVGFLLGVNSLGDHVLHSYLVNGMSWLLTGVLTYWTILGAGYAIAFARKYQMQQLRSSELAGELARAHLSVLRNQLHPHFLFNTLNTVTSLVRVQRTESAIGVLTSLSDILRRLLRNAPEQEVTLREELQFLNSYVEIEKTRFSDRLSMRIDVSEELMDAIVPSLLLQPLVENAIRYGIGGRTAPGHVSVSARRSGDRLLLKIRDDGPGFPHDWTAGANCGVGLSNTQARLEQMYGSAHEFMLGNAEAGGTEVTIVIPFRIIADSDRVQRQKAEVLFGDA